MSRGAHVPELVVAQCAGSVRGAPKKHLGSVSCTQDAATHLVWAISYTDAGKLRPHLFSGREAGDFPRWNPRCRSFGSVKVGLMRGKGVGFLGNKCPAVSIDMSLDFRGWE